MNTITDISKHIEHTLLSPNATNDDFRSHCEAAIKWKFPVVIVPPTGIKVCSWLLADTTTEIGTVIGFPLGYSHHTAKTAEIEEAFCTGATHIDFVINRYLLRHSEEEFQTEISAISDCIFKVGWIGDKKITSKAIIETSELTLDEIRRVCEILSQYSFDYVKTSTGFFGGATIPLVRLIREVVGDTMQIKASGKISTLQHVMAFLNAGADRIGTSKGDSIMTETLL